jgi:Trypsin
MFFKKSSSFGVAFALATLACGTTPQTSRTDNAPSVAESQDELIGGVKLSGEALEAVGVLAIDFLDGSPLFELCTATLVAPNVVVTAKHCVGFGSFFYHDNYPVFFAVGEDLANVRVKTPVVAAHIAPGTEGWFGLGLDVAYLNLADPITDVKPLGVANGWFGPSDLSKKFAVAGFGLHNYAGAAGDRRVGAYSLSAVEGGVYAALFGNLAEYLKWFSDLYAQYGITLTPEEVTSLTDAYNKNPIIVGEQAYFGGKVGEANTAPGDSGGPTIGKFKNADGSESLAVYAVTTGGLSDNAPRFGTFAALTGGGKAQALRQAALAWVDPCAGVTSFGSCQGDVATRCTVGGEGPRRVTQTDCSLLGLSCVAEANKLAGCGAASAATVVTVTKEVANELSAKVLKASRLDARELASRKPQ